MKSNLSNEGKLLCALNVARFDSEAVAQARALVAEGVDWKKLASLAELNAVPLLTSNRLKTLGIIPPATITEKANAQRSLCEARLESARVFLAAMADASIDVILLKGGLMSTIYDVAAYKKMNDVDVMVRWEDVPRALLVLKKLGYSSVGALFGKKEVSSKSHHTPPYVSSDLSCVIGLHWGLHSPLAPWKTDIQAIWGRAKPIDFFGVRAWRMGWEDNLLHLCIHLPFYKIGLRELADVYNLVDHAEDDFEWTLFSRLVSEAGAADPVYRVLTLARALHYFTVPGFYIEAWESQASWLTVRDTKARIAGKQDVLVYSRSVHIAKIEKAYSIFRVTGQYREKLKAWLAMWLLLLFPSEAERLRILGKLAFHDRFDRFISRFRAPVRIWCAMARDLGQIPLALVTLYNAALIVRESILRPFRKEGMSLKEHPARKLLEVLE